MKASKTTRAVFLRNFVFGVEDSLVSTVGLLSGIAAANETGATIFLTGSVLIVVEAFSMAVGSLLSEESTEEYQNRKHSNTRSLGGGVIMFFSYALAGLIPLGPYAFFDRSFAVPASITGSLIGLFILGYFSGRRFGTRPWRSSLRMFLLGGIAILAGALVGSILKS